MASNDSRVVISVIFFIGTATILTISGIIWLAYMGLDVPEALTVLGGTALGGLVAMLTTTRSSKSEQPAGTPSDPISTEATVINKPLQVQEAAPAVSTATATPTGFEDVEQIAIDDEVEEEKAVPSQ